MKFRVAFKDPDALIDAIDEATAKGEFPGLEEEEAQAVQEIRKENVRELCLRWFEFGEYLTVEIDTEAKTCIVVPRK
jgi:hypothetical protein